MDPSESKKSKPRLSVLRLVEGGQKSESVSRFPVGGHSNPVDDSVSRFFQNFQKGTDVDEPRVEEDATVIVRSETQVESAVGNPSDIPDPTAPTYFFGRNPFYGPGAESRVSPERRGTGPGIIEEGTTAETPLHGQNVSPIEVPRKKPRLAVLRRPQESEQVGPLRDSVSSFFKNFASTSQVASSSRDDDDTLKTKEIQPAQDVEMEEIPVSSLFRRFREIMDPSESKKSKPRLSVLRLVEGGQKSESVSRFPVGGHSNPVDDSVSRFFQNFPKGTDVDEPRVEEDATVIVRSETQVESAVGNPSDIADPTAPTYFFGRNPFYGPGAESRVSPERRGTGPGIIEEGTTAETPLHGQNVSPIEVPRKKPRLAVLRRPQESEQVGPLRDSVSSFFKNFASTSQVASSSRDDDDTLKTKEIQPAQDVEMEEIPVSSLFRRFREISNMDETPEDRKKRLARERQQKHRAKLTDEQKKDNRKANVAFRRSQETAEETEARRQRDRAWHLSSREQETPEEAEARRQRDRASHLSSREQETPEEAEARRQRDRASHLSSRQQETPEESAVRRHVNTAAQFAIRSQELAAETEARRQRDAVSHFFRRFQESAEETEIRQRADAAAHAAQNEQQINVTRYRVQSQMSQSDIDESVVEPHYCGPMNIICQFCGSRNFVDERPRDGKFNNCCHKGKVRLTRDPLGYPSFLESMLTNTGDPNYRNFRKHIRSYNSALSFASMGATYKEVPGRGPYVFQVQGQVYHRTSHMTGSGSDTRQYAQLYVLDSTQAVERRMQHPANQGCLRQILDQIDRFFRVNNKLAQSYKMMREVQEAEEIRAQREGRTVPVVSLEFTRDRQSDQRRYNEPTANEIAMVFVDNDGEPPFERDIRVYERNPLNPNQHFVPLSILSPNLDPMTYAILFPYGEAGWQKNWSCIGYDNVRHSVSMLQYKVAHTAIRDYFNPVMRAGNLTQQWIVDSYLQVEANNLNWARFNQSKYRSELYTGLADYVANRAEAAGRVAGRPVILPSSFEGSPRNMRERLHDAMSIFGKFGSLDLFVTFTANPKWKEITENLEPGETASDRPDIVARVFKLKLKALIRDLTVNMVLGKSIAYVYTIEFQKRGLPHAHILIVLADEDKFRSADRIDRLVCAEIPDPVQNPRLHSIVTRCMIHGPCGGANSTAPCMKEGACSKNFPKEFGDYTTPSKTGYANYRRRMGRTVVKNGKTMDNRNVVPYNKFLLLKYDAHINVEVCTSMRAVKYIYKYIYKGFDCANITVGVGVDNNQLLIHDEIKNYIDARYVSAPEAMWRLLEFKMHDRSHAIYRLPVHLQNQQEVRFEEGHEEEALEQARGADTKLTAWFKLNQTDPSANVLLYTEIPHHYTFKNCRWNVRKQGAGKIITRMYTVAANDRERFYLRLLLLHVRGATSFEFLRTVNDVVYPTFYLAALHRNLLSTDDEWDKCMQEASVFQMPAQLRHTFAYILIYCLPTNVNDDPNTSLWGKYKKDMILDYLQHHNEDVATNLALHDIQSVLQQSGKSCSDYNLPEPTGTVEEVRNYQATVERANAERLIPTLNTEQLAAFDKIVEGINNPSAHKLYFLNGPGGSGKTYLYNTLMSYVRGQGKSILAFATTGIAATLIPDGSTVHSGFGLPLRTEDDSRSNIRQDSRQADALRNADAIIIDEVSMMTKDGLRICDQIVRDVMKKKNVPFGGKVVILGGDFAQTLPVVVRGGRRAVVEASIKSSRLFRDHFKKLSLITNMRSAAQNTHNQWLLDIGTGSLPVINGLSINAVEIPGNMIIETDIVNTIFGNNVRELSVDELTRRVILCTTNKETLEINSKVMQQLDGDMRVYCSSDSIISEDIADVHNYPVEFLNAQTPSGMPPHKLCLKVGGVVMLLRNLNRQRGLCNGTRLIIRNLHEHFITCEIISESHKGEIVFISRINLTPSDSNLPFKLQRRQFPIIPAFAVTINKSQGQSYDIVGIYLNEPVFSHGQLYVALSRSRNPANIKVFITEGRRQGRLLGDDRWFTENVVYGEIFD